MTAVTAPGMRRPGRGGGRPRGCCNVPGNARACLAVCMVICMVVCMNVTVSGCAALLPQLQPPQMSLNGIAFRSGSLQRQQFELSVHVVNPNASTIAIDHIEVHLQLNGAAFADGTAASAFALPPSAATDINLEVTTHIVDALVAVAASKEHRTVNYRLYGEVRLQHGWVPTLPFDHRGRLEL
jgi:LEA14-like dessication related protein